MMSQRVRDVLIAVLGLLVLWPVFLVIAALIKLTSPGPVFHRAGRVGKGGRLFTLYKFRSMSVNAAHVGPGITRAGDPRITPLGHRLRQWKLDELPQLWNVLKGEMSLIGPRPEDPRYVARYTPEHRRVLTVRPGLTSPASLRYRHEAALLQGENWEQQYLTQVMPDKLRIELDYLEHRSWVSDVQILWQTLLALFG
jgi:lipopolysaccharide/colanic/teichoic acid biosynthesis glycosyltransferase